MTTERFLPYGRQSIDDEDIEAVVGVLRSPFLTTGPEVRAFEEAVADQVGARHAVAVSSGTAALHCAMYAAGIGPEDEVIVPAISFVASANCVRYLGARVRFVDVEPDSGLLDREQLEAALSPRTRAVIPVHMNGHLVDLPWLRAWCEARGLLLVDDAAHAIGGSWEGRRIGGDGLSHLSCFSFHPVKHVTTGEGGVVTTDDDERAARARQARDHGLERDPARMKSVPEGPWVYEQHGLGFNYRMTDLQCALGKSQLRRLERFIDRRRALADRYDAAFARFEHLRPVAGRRPGSAYHLYAVLIDFEAVGTDRATVMSELRDRGIGTQVHYMPIPSQPYYRALGHDADAFPGARRYYERILSLPMFPDLRDEDADRVVRSLAEVLGEASA